ncbi:hypothetical protein AAEY22_004187, partial [Escherichia coli]
MVHLPLYYRYHRLASCAIACNDISVTGINKLIVEASHFVSWLTQRDELECQAWENNDSSIRTGDDDGLLC